MRMSMTVITIVGIFAAVGRADWESVNFRSAQNEPKMVVGPGRAFSTTRPSAGEWTASFTLANNFANLVDQPIAVYSAKVVNFEDYNVASGNAGMSSHLAFRVDLSEPVLAVVWDIGQHGRNVSPGARLVARYSRDGQRWIDALLYPPGQDSTFDPPPIHLNFDPPTQALYVGWFAEVPPGQTGWWNQGGTGQFTFIPARSPAAQVAAPVKGARETLQGPRRVPPDFFGTTMHVNSESGLRLLKDLGVPNARIDFHWAGLEPGLGSYNFGPDVWMIRSADLGIQQKVDQLVVLGVPPQWATTPNGTWPNDQSLAALEEFMFRIASKYKGQIRHWQAGNEPNMAIWKARFVAFLKAYYRGVKRADPQNKVVLSGLAGVDHLHLDAIYRHGGKGYFDILGSHPYTRPAMPEEGGFIGKIEAFRDVMRKYGDDKPLWITEIGWNGVEPSMLEYLRAKWEGHRVYSVTEEDQARGLARTYLIAATIPWIERVYFFHLHQEAQYTELADNVDYYMGLFTPWLDGQVRPKDAYFAVKTVIRMIREAQYVERIDMGPRVWSLVFERPNEAMIALWSLDDGVTLKLDDTTGIGGVTSMVGTPVLLKEGILRLSGRPLYMTVSKDKVAGTKAQLQRTLRRS